MFVEVRLCLASVLGRDRTREVESDSGLFPFKTFQAPNKFDLQNSREAEMPVGGQRWEGVTPCHGSPVTPRETYQKETAAASGFVAGHKREKKCGVVLQTRA